MSVRPAGGGDRSGFGAAMTAKDLRLAQSAAKAAGAKTELGVDVERIYSAYADSGEAERDFSRIIRFIRG